MAYFSCNRLHWTRLCLLYVVLTSLFTPALMVKRENFKTCDQSGFCKRNRAYADAASSLFTTWNSPYNLHPASVNLKDGQLSGIILKSVKETGDVVRLPVVIAFLESGLARVTVDEEKRQMGDVLLRHDSKARKERYNEAQDWAIVGGLKLDSSAVLKGSDDAVTRVQYGPAGKFEAVIRHSPFAIDFMRNNEIHIRFNERGLLNMEQWRAKVEKKIPVIPEGDDNRSEEEKKAAEEAAKEAESKSNVDESSWWEETFGGKTDSKPRGPESVALDISFPGYEHVFGIPSHATSLSLKETRGGDGKYSEPYRMYNADVFQYEMDSPMTLYGSIPLMQAHRKDSTVAVFWLNAAETWVDIVKSKGTTNPLSLGINAKTDTKTHWISESGLMDVFVFLGPSPQDISQKYGELTGYTQLPQYFAIAYHQCRWNYVTDQDVMDVERKFDKHKIPLDVLWLDIEYTDGKKYFTWDPLKFPNPDKMLKQLDSHERKLVTIIDPHIKNTDSYPVVDELKSKNLAVRNKDDNLYEGWCWPGSSHWIDCFNPAAIEWWKSLFKYDKFTGTASNTFIWNDMNEPSVFDGAETTMPKDNLHHGNWEHRDVHNINGMTFQNATYQALLSRSKAENSAPRRPFVLTRSFFAGSQRVGAMWTGDNEAHWSHLVANLPMILSQGISGFPFAGADVGGFFGNPEKELLTRWYQAGAFNPFFRAHAHIDTRRREPYLAGSPHTEIITQAIRLRYSLLPAWYTAFHEASTKGSPIVRPNFYVHPSDERGFALEDQMYIGDTGLLVKPVTAAGQESVSVHLADDEHYFDYFTYTSYRGPGSVTIPAPLDTIPLLMRAGHIFPRRDRPRRSSGLMKHDPLTLVVVLGAAGAAHGAIYLDDGESFDFEQGASVHRLFTFSPEMTLSSVQHPDAPLPAKPKVADKYKKQGGAVRVERVVVVNPPASWAEKGNAKVFETDDAGKKKEWRVKYRYFAPREKDAGYAIVKDPKVKIGRDWKIDFES